MPQETMILTDREREIHSWYWHEFRTIKEIAVWLKCSPQTVARHIAIIRAIFRSHGQDLQKFDRGRPRAVPDRGMVGIIG